MINMDNDCVWCEMKVYFTWFSSQFSLFLTRWHFFVFWFFCRSCSVSKFVVLHCTISRVPTTKSQTTSPYICNFALYNKQIYLLAIPSSEMVVGNLTKFNGVALICHCISMYVCCCSVCVCALLFLKILFGICFVDYVSLSMINCFQVYYHAM